MRALVYHRPEQLELAETADANAEARRGAGPDPVRRGICGTDLHLWHGEMTAVKPPVVVGHELVGEVVEDTTANSPPAARRRRAAAGLRHLSGVPRRRLARLPQPRVQGVHANGGAAEMLRTPDHPPAPDP